MVFDTTVRHFKLFDGTNYVIVGQSAGIVKCFRAFPVFGNDMFKPLSKTKPLTTPLFGLSEVVWSTIIHDYFNPDTPIYKLAVCEGYDVQFVHVKCLVRGTGHIRLRLKHKNHTGGNWINRDPAAVADTTSGNVRSIWCEDGYLIAYDPSWIFTDLYSS